MTSASPLAPFLGAQRAVILDGGLATELEARGHVLNDALWSARVLLERPEAVRAVHLDYLRAGADCIASATYQATLEGLVGRGAGHAEAVAQLREGVEIAVAARDEFWSVPDNRPGRLRPLVAASVGPYGAFLADGSEYTGDYGLTADELLEFHRERWEILAQAGADLLACETVPSAVEASALIDLIAGTPGVWAWLSFSCRDDRHVSDGTPLRDVARLCEGTPGLAAVGINCTAPRFVEALIGEARAATSAPVLVYPNSGERYDAAGKRWLPGADAPSWPTAAARWVEAGAAGVGGCCRVGPADIAAVRAALSPLR